MPRCRTVNSHERGGACATTEWLTRVARPESLAMPIGFRGLGRGLVRQVFVNKLATPRGGSRSPGAGNDLGGSVSGRWEIHREARTCQTPPRGSPRWGANSTIDHSRGADLGIRGRPRKFPNMSGGAAVEVACVPDPRGRQGLVDKRH